ncbi:MAG TPA: T9SS type A sorting domain-containing protein, partial [Phaeodactylibacter sp.]|nr:T9SS type A sorting domain-containing protein [Phaeodactylibacter sp.]
KVFDLNGKQVLQTNTATQIGINQTSIKIDGLVSGIYFVHISGNKGDSSQLKFVKN